MYCIRDYFSTVTVQEPTVKDLKQPAIQYKTKTSTRNTKSKTMQTKGNRNEIIYTVLSQSCLLMATVTDAGEGRASLCILHVAH